MTGGVKVALRPHAHMSPVFWPYSVYQRLYFESPSSHEESLQVDSFTWPNLIIPPDVEYPDLEWTHTHTFIKPNKHQGENQASPKFSQD